MTDFIAPVPPRSTNAPFVAVIVSLVVVALVAAVCGFKLYQTQEALALLTTQSQAQVAALTTERDEAKEMVGSLTSQLEAAEKQVAELQPLADKARTMPITLRIDRHALNAGYNLFVYNRARISLRFRYTVNGSELHTGPKPIRGVIDGGGFAIIPGLASGDVVVIHSDGFDDRTVKIQ